MRGCASTGVTLGVVAGLVGGKFLGIGLTTLLAAHPRLGRLPLTIELPKVFGVAAVAGIGFTLSLFIAELAFQGEELEEAKVGVLAASLAAALLGYAVFEGMRHIPQPGLKRAGLTPAEPLIDLAVPVDPERDHVRGMKDAAVTLVEYGDFECPYCRRAEAAIRELLTDFANDLRYVWRHLPLSDVHPQAQLAAEAAEAAAAQGAFRPMHDLLISHQEALELPDLKRYAGELGLNLECFWDDLRSRTHAPRIADDVDSADASRVSGTPSFFVNGRRHEDAYDIETLSRLVREALAAASGASGRR